MKLRHFLYFTALFPSLAFAVGPYGPSAAGIQFPAQFAPASGGGAAALVVQSTNNNVLSGNTNIKAFPSANTAGNMLRLSCVAFESGGASLTSIADTALNTWTVVSSSINPNNVNFLQIVAYAKNSNAGANTVTVTFDVTQNGSACIFSEISGLSATTPLEISSVSVGQTNIAMGGRVAASANTKLITGSITDDEGSATTLFTPELNYIRWGYIPDNNANVAHAFETYGTSNAIVASTVYTSSWSINTSNWMSTIELWK